MIDPDRGKQDELAPSIDDPFGSPRTLVRDLTETLELSLLEAAHGGARSLTLRPVSSCAACGGRGGAAGATFVPCSTCGGRGGTESTRGAFVTRTRCGACAGSKGAWTEACAPCAGRGEVASERQATVQIPPGITAGSMLRLAGLGNDLGKGPGDALLLVEVAPHPGLARVGDDLYARVPLDAARRATGGSVTVPWLTGARRVRVPPGIDERTEVRIRGWGCVRLGSPFAPPPSDESPYRGGSATPRGDLVVTFPAPAPHQASPEPRRERSTRALAGALGLAALLLGALLLATR